MHEELCPGPRNSDHGPGARQVQARGWLGDVLPLASHARFSMMMRVGTDARGTAKSERSLLKDRSPWHQAAGSERTSRHGLGMGDGGWRMAEGQGCVISLITDLVGRKLHRICGSQDGGFLRGRRDGCWHCSNPYPRPPPPQQPSLPKARKETFVRSSIGKLFYTWKI